MHAGSDHSGAAKEEIGREPVIMLKDAPGTSEKGARVFALLPKKTGACVRPDRAGNDPAG